MELESIVFGILIAVTLYMFIISVSALIKGKTLRMFFVMGAFFLFLTRSVLMALYIFNEFLDVRTVFIMIGMLDTLALLSLYAGILKR